MLLPHWGYDIFGFFTSFTHFHPFLHTLCSCPPHLRLISPHHGDAQKAIVTSQIDTYSVGPFTHHQTGILKRE